MLNYSMVIQWSQKDGCFVVTLPEWGEQCQTYGDTYEQALKNGKEVLQLMVTSSIEEEGSLPEVKTFQGNLQTVQTPS